MSLSVVVITRNESANLRACLQSVAFADEIVVVDNGSTDGTADIARARGATLFCREWSGWVDQKNHAARLASHDWIFSLDADERIPPALGAELRGLLSSEPPIRARSIPSGRNTSFRTYSS